MDIRIKLQPSVHKDKCKSTLVRRITNNRGWSISNMGIGYTPIMNRNRNRNRDDILVYNIEKRGYKSEQIKYTSGFNKGKTKKSNVLRHKHWVAYVYTFSPELLKAMGKKVRQGKRTFTFEDIK